MAAAAAMVAAVAADAAAEDTVAAAMAEAAAAMAAAVEAVAMEVTIEVLSPKMKMGIYNILKVCRLKCPYSAFVTTINIRPESYFTSFSVGQIWSLLH